MSEDKDKPLGTGGTQTTSTSLYKGKDVRLDVENPNPGKRPGQIHVHYKGEKYIYDIQSKSFLNAPKVVNELLENPRFQDAIDKG